MTTVLPPAPSSTEERRLAKAVRQGIFRNVVRAIVAERNATDLLFEIYCAGLYHGKSIGGPERQRDYLDMAPPRPKRGRPRKVD